LQLQKYSPWLKLDPGSFFNLAGAQEARKRASVLVAGLGGGGTGKQHRKARLQLCRCTDQQIAAKKPVRPRQGSQRHSPLHIIGTNTPDGC
jgi:hypothetical protein